MGKFLKFMLIALVLEWSGSQCAKMKVGSLDEKPADEKITQLIQQVQSQMSSYDDISISQKKALSPISYKTQVVAGTIYFIKAKAEGTCVVLRIDEKLPRMIQNGEEAVSLRGIRKINSCKDEIQYFEPESIKKAKKTGPSDEKPADKEINGVVKQVQSQMSSYGLLNSRKNPLEPISYKEQVAAGKIYFVKAQQKADRTCVLLRISKNLPYMVKKGEKTISLTGIKKMNSCKDEIEYFEPTESKQLGGPSSDEQPADKKINLMVQKLQSQMTSYDTISTSTNNLKPISYKKQIVAGTIYFVKAQLKSGGKCVLLRIYEKLPYMVKEGGEAVSLDGIKPIKSCGEKIEFFVPESTKN